MLQINIDEIQNQNNRTKYIFFNLRKIDNRNKWKYYVIVTRVKLSAELDVLVIHEQPEYLYNFNHQISVVFFTLRYLKNESRI